MVTRLAGINTGLDIESMVANLMKAEKMPLDSLQQKKTLLTWKTDAYREINTKLSALKNALDNMRLSGDWKQNKAASSNESAVTVTADGTSNKTSHSIRIGALAEGSSLSSASSVANGQVNGKDISGKVPIDISSAKANNQFTITLSGVTRTITIQDGTYTDAASLAAAVQTQVDSAFGTYTYKNSSDVDVTTSKISVSSNGGALSFKVNPSADPSAVPPAAGATPASMSVGKVSGNTGLDSVGLTAGQSNRLNAASQLKDSLGITGTNTLTVNGVSIEYKETDTLTTLMNKVNNSNAGVSMSYDSTSDKFIFTTKDTGTAAVINLSDSDVTGGFLSKANVTRTYAQGKDAEVTIDGVTSTYSSNTITTGGVTYTLKQTTGSDAVSVGVSQDVDSTLTKIKAFITAYNDAIGLMNTRVKEVKDRNYSPLTDDQRSDLSDTDIEKWEKAAKVGVLHSDSLLKSSIDSMRSLLTLSVSTVPNTSYNALYKIGIETKSYNASAPEDSGKLQLDEDALKKALQDDPDSVVKLFSSQPGGIAQKLYDQVNKSVKDISKKAGGNSTALDNVTTDIGLDISKLNQRIATLTDKLADKEDYYYKMFAAMDTAVGKSNSTLSWLSQNMG
jgi:Flagellar capping protein